MRAFFVAVALIGATGCGDGTTASDLATCAPLVGGIGSQCRGCAPVTGDPCGTEEEGAQCPYAGGDYCVCSRGRWSCSSQPFPAPADLSLPRD